MERTQADWFDPAPLSQGDIGKRTRLLRCYISRVENRHTVPSVEMLEKMTIALEVTGVPALPLEAFLPLDKHLVNGPAARSGLADFE